MIEQKIGKYVVVGAGLMGINALRNLLENGVAVNEILLVDSQIGRNIEREKKTRTLFEISREERAMGGLGKRGKNVLHESSSGSNFSASDNWGLSCFPYTKNTVDEWKLNNEILDQNWKNVIKFMSIQSPGDSFI